MNESFLSTGCRYMWIAPQSARDIRFECIGSIFHDGLEFYQIKGITNPDYLGEISRGFIQENYKKLIKIGNARSEIKIRANSRNDREFTL